MSFPVRPDLEPQIKRLPNSPGVYFFYDVAGRLLYVGKSVNLRTRVRSYFRAEGGHSRRTARLKEEAVRIDSQRCGTELEALLVESKLIKKLNPLYNVLGRTYKHYPFIKIPDEPFPRVQLSYQLQEDGAAYYGPFPSEYRAREALEAMRPLFRWRTCQPLANRVCFEQAIGRCTAPCVGHIDEAGYAAMIKDLVGFLTGDGHAHLVALERQMNEAAESLMFERAAKLRDRLTMLRPLVQRQNALQAAISELDCLVVLPSVEAGRWLWLVVRRGRLVATFDQVTTRQRVSLTKRLAAVMAEAPPTLTVRQWELDEINIISGWLHQNRGSEQAIALSGRPVEEAVEEAIALMGAMRAPRARQVAERAAEKVVPGPEA